jgi:hypothetical protein
MSPDTLSFENTERHHSPNRQGNYNKKNCFNRSHILPFTFLQWTEKPDRVLSSTRHRKTLLGSNDQTEARRFNALDVDNTGVQKTPLPELVILSWNFPGLTTPWNIIIPGEVFKLLMAFCWICLVTACHQFPHVSWHVQRPPLRHPRRSASHRRGVVETAFFVNGSILSWHGDLVKSLTLPIMHGYYFPLCICWQTNGVAGGYLVRYLLV